MSTVVSAGSRAVGRSLKVLVPLIKEELEAGDSAGVEHYRQAGDMLLEAKEQVAHGEWIPWLSRNFHLSHSTAKRYMSLASQKGPARSFSSLREAVSPGQTSKVSWQRPVQEIAARVNLEALSQERTNREAEKKLMRGLSHQLIDIGYKVLAAKLHPDKPGGSTDAMKRLNEVRKLLKEAL